MGKVKTKTRGKIYPKETMFFRHQVGDAKSESGKAYEMTTNVADMAPIVCSKKTGKWFSLSWQDIIELAVEAGIDK